MQRRWHAKRLHRPSHGFPGLYPPRRKVIRVAPPPRRLPLPAARRLTLRPAAGMPPGAYSVVGTEPTMADATRTLPGNRHDEPSSPSPAPLSVPILGTTLVGHFWKADPGHSPKAPKNCHRCAKNTCQTHLPAVAPNRAETAASNHHPRSPPHPPLQISHCHANRVENCDLRTQTLLSPTAKIAPPRERFSASPEQKSCVAPTISW